MNSWARLGGALLYLTNPDGSFKIISLSIEWRTRVGPADSSVQIRLLQQFIPPPNFGIHLYTKPTWNPTLIARPNDALIGRCVKLLRKAAAQMVMDLYSCGLFFSKFWSLPRSLLFFFVPPQQPGSAFWWCGDGRSVVDRKSSQFVLGRICGTIVAGYCVAVWFPVGVHPTTTGVEG